MTKRTHGDTARRAPARRRADAASSAARILAATRALVGPGIDKVSLEDIAAEAGVGIATLYRHFPNREALARAVYEDLFATEVMPFLDEAARHPSPVAALRAVAEKTLELIDSERGLFDRAGVFSEITMEALTRASAPIQAILKRGQDLGEIRPDLTPDDIPRFLVFGIAGMALPGATPATRTRLLTLLFDALHPAHTTPLPPAPPEDLQTTIRSTPHPDPDH
ncbi:TetR/AcrR family transcriptional regulator; helix-turn-helix transcriptional regulator [Actinocorallia sp. API 0066]|uniref:TetR/AcrR family transcriptional regulator n=1 Tax=Actinocorallia sp. API 0066 TaxID=2896846 RepID=UPI001E64A103|nr:TetR/AcrR family transcriptional regulator [Actinocorallia sp. API 0066]MCD0451675.1 TetR/AcrR family transcriptional regulator; helix-turn-helix transcriptional regulator [Actinocorallia sp. API 0066]